jgi:hypothetical protein
MELLAKVPPRLAIEPAVQRELNERLQRCQKMFSFLRGVLETKEKIQAEVSRSLRA